MIFFGVIGQLLDLHPAQAQRDDAGRLRALDSDAADVVDVRYRGKDEPVMVESFCDAHEYLYRLVKALSSESK
ncbi:MAG TPA: hypothetical protein VFK10_06490 [Burkholderiaceae bacterium]|nr:hypothetical protein [Burkholderiaceae bacterium]